MSSPLSCKLIVLGDSGVGKTTIIHKFINQEFRADFKATIGADFSTKTCFAGNKQVELQIWDTAGEERFHSVGAAFYRGTDACILVYDITNHLSFERLDVWRKDLIEKADIDSTDFPFIIFANKCDLEDQRQVSISEAESFANTYSCMLFEVSAKSGQNVEKGFQTLAEQFLKSSNKVRTVDISFKVTDTTSNNKGCC